MRSSCACVVLVRVTGLRGPPLPDALPPPRPASPLERLELRVEMADEVAVELELAELVLVVVEELE